MSGLEQRLKDFSMENERLKHENCALRKKIEVLNSEVSTCSCFLRVCSKILEYLLKALKPHHRVVCILITIPVLTFAE